VSDCRILIVLVSVYVEREIETVARRGDEAERCGRRAETGLLAINFIFFGFLLCFFVDKFHYFCGESREI